MTRRPLIALCILLLALLACSVQPVQPDKRILATLAKVTVTPTVTATAEWQGQMWRVAP